MEAKEKAKILSDDLAFKVKSIAKNSGANFLSGVSTTSFSAPLTGATMTIGQLQGTIGAIQDAGGLGNVAAGMVDNVKEQAAAKIDAVKGAVLNSPAANAIKTLSELTPEEAAKNLGNNLANAGLEIAAIAADIVTSCVGSFAEELASYTGTVVAELASLDLSMIGQQMASYLTAGIKKPDELIKEIMTSAEKQVENAEKKQEENAKKKKMVEIQAKMQAFEAKMDKIMTEVKQKIDTVMEYIEQGPEWLEFQLSSILDKGMSYVYKYAAIAVSEVNAQKEKFINDMAYKLAQKAAAKINEKALLVQKAIIDTAARITAKLLAIAKALIAKALMLLMGLLGG